MNILTDLQERVLKILFGLDDIRRHFYLTGGTALAAYYLKHRRSDDLDLFTHSIEVNFIERIVEDELRGANLKVAAERKSPTFRRYIVEDSLQLDLVRDVDFRVGTPLLIDQIMVDSEKNIAVNKLLAIYGRLDPKDYVDFFFLLRSENYDINELMALGRLKDAGLEAFQWAKVIADVDSISVLPRMLVPCDTKELVSFFHRLRDEILDGLKKKIRR